MERGERPGALPLGCALEAGDGRLTLRFPAPWRALASTVLGGGYGRRRGAVWLRVPLDYAVSDAGADARARLRAGVGCLPGGQTGGPWAAFLTAVDLRGVAWCAGGPDGRRVLAVATAGAGNASTAGLTVPPAAEGPSAGTVCVAAVVETSLSAAGLANAFQTLTEARVRAFLDVGVRTRDGAPAFGTSTDAAVVASVGVGRQTHYAGSATQIGYWLARCVHDAVLLALARNARRCRGIRGTGGGDAAGISAHPLRVSVSPCGG